MGTRNDWLDGDIMLEKQTCNRKFFCLRQCSLALSAAVLCSCSSTHTWQSADENKLPAAVAGGEYATVNGENLRTTTVAVASGDNASYPGDFPFVQYPGSRVILSVVSPGNSNKSVSLETQDAPDRAVAYYQSWFANNGWTIAQQSNTAGMAAISAQKQNQLVSIMSMPGTGTAGKNTIQITVSSSK